MGRFNFDKETIFYPRYNWDIGECEIVRLEDEDYSKTNFFNIKYKR